jgi:hypothetical protein
VDVIVQSLQMSGNVTAIVKIYINVNILMLPSKYKCDIRTRVYN